MLLPPQFKDEALKTLGPPIRKDQEKKPVEVEVRPGIYRVNGKLETRIPENEEAEKYPWAQPYQNVVLHQNNGSEVDIPLPEFKPVWRREKPETYGEYTVRWALDQTPRPNFFVGKLVLEVWDEYKLERLDEGR